MAKSHRTAQTKSAVLIANPTPPTPDSILLLPDAGPLITLAYADALDLLYQPGWRLAVVDMVLHELTRNQTPTSAKIAQWIADGSAQQRITILPTQTFAQYGTQAEKNSKTISPSQRVKKSHLGKLAIQETINQLALQPTPQTAVLLFEDHRIARTSFYLPPCSQKISTRAFLIFLEQKGWLTSAIAIERQAIQASRSFSQLRFPPG
jgi:hypothetical protein